MANEVKTLFTAEPKQLFKALDDAERRLTAFENRVGKLGAGNPLAAPSYKPIDPESVKGQKEAAALQIKIAQQEAAIEKAKQATLKTTREQLAVEQARLSLLAKQDKITPAKISDVEKKLSEPTISGYWEKEANEVKRSVAEIKTATASVSKPQTGLANAGQNSLNRMAVGIDSGETKPKTQLFDRAVNDYLEGVQKKSAETSASVNKLQKDFSSLAAQRIEGGSVGNLTKEVVKASERSRQLRTDISQIKSEIANPNRKSSIAFLTEELKGAEREADRLNRKLATVSAKDGKTGGRQANGRGRAGSVTSGQATFLELADDFAPEGFNKPFNAVGRTVFAAQNIKEAAGEMSLLSGISLTTLATFGAMAATGLAIVTVTQNVRTEAERRLKVEEGIASAVNKQIFSQKELAREFAEQRANAARGDNFSQFTKGASVEDLTRRKKALEELIKLSPAQVFSDLPEPKGDPKTAAEKNFASYVADRKRVQGELNKGLASELANNQRELLAVEQRIRDVSRERIKETGDNFNQSFTNEEKSRQNRLESEKRYADKLSDYTAKGFRDTLQNSKTTIAELKKGLQDVFNSGDLKADAKHDLVKGFTEKIEAEINEAKKKIDELGKKGSEAFENLFAQSNKENPFILVFSETDKAVDKLNENIKNLPVSLQKSARAMQNTINANSLFSTRLDNDFASFNLKSRADELRSYKPKVIEDAGKFFSDFIEAGLKQIAEENGGVKARRYNLTMDGKGGTFGFSQSNEDPYTRYNLTEDGKGGTFGFSQSDARNSVYNTYNRTETSDKGILGGFYNRPKDFGDLTDGEKNEFINRDNKSLQQNLSKAFDLAGNRTALNDEQQSLIDRKIISLAQGVKPEQLTDYQRNLVATANEKEAERRGDVEKRANELREEQAGYLKNISDFVNAQKKAAANGEKSETLIRIVNDSDFDARSERKSGLKPAPTPDDTARAYQFNQFDFQ